MSKTSLDIDELILKNLQYNDEFIRKVIPYIKAEYFHADVYKTYFEGVKEYFEKYNKIPDASSLKVHFGNLSITEDQYQNLLGLSDKIDEYKEEKQNIDWLVDEAEKFCKDRALSNALIEAAVIADGGNKNLTTTSIPDILSKALAVSFDTHIGHEYYAEAEDRFEFFNQKVSKLPFHLQTFNNITNGGVEYKTINCVAAPTNVGKSLFLCDLAAGYISLGIDVLYITLEMAEEKISQRIDANIMGIPMNKFESITKQEFMTKIEKANPAKGAGRFIVKEYPQGSAHAGHFKYLLKELKTKRNFEPKVIMVDYIGICASSRLKNRSDMYMYGKSIAEELRAMAQETNTIVWTAQQLNRNALTATDIGMEHSAESFGQPQGYDFYFALIKTEELARNGQLMVKQLKSRYGDIFDNQKFIIGLDQPKMRLYDLSTTNTHMTGQKPQAPQQLPKPTTVKPTSKNSLSGIKV